MTGALIEIQPKSRFRESDICLYANPDGSIFYHAWQRPQRFVKQNIELPYTGTCGFGQTVYVDLNLKKGHLLGAMTLKYTLPGIRHKSEKIHAPRFNKCHIRPDDEASHNVVDDSLPSNQNHPLPKRHVYWANAIGHVLTEEVAFLIDSSDAVCHSGEWMEVLDEHTTPIGKNTDEMIGRHRTLRKLWLKSKRRQVRYVPLRLFFCEYIEECLVICGVDHTKSKLQLRIRIRELQGCFYTSDTVTPYLMESDHELRADHIKLTVYANIYYITPDEIREKFDSGHRHLITQLQYNGGPAIKKTNSVTNANHPCKLPFCKPISELVWVVQPEQHIGLRDWFNWSGLHKDDPVEKAALRIGGQYHITEREGKWFRTIEPREHHTNIPGRHIYSVSFAQCPEKLTTCTGSYTPLSGDDMQLHLKLQKGLGSSLFKCWATNWNVFEITPNRIAGLAF